MHMNLSGNNSATPSEDLRAGGEPPPVFSRPVLDLRCSPVCERFILISFLGDLMFQGATSVIHQTGERRYKP